MAKHGRRKPSPASRLQSKIRKKEAGDARLIADYLFDHEYLPVTTGNTPIRGNAPPDRPTTKSAAGNDRPCSTTMGRTIDDLGKSSSPPCPKPSGPRGGVIVVTLTDATGKRLPRVRAEPKVGPPLVKHHLRRRSTAGKFLFLGSQPRGLPKSRPPFNIAQADFACLYASVEGRPWPFNSKEILPSGVRETSAAKKIGDSEAGPRL